MNTRVLDLVKKPLIWAVFAGPLVTPIAAGSVQTTDAVTQSVVSIEASVLTPVRPSWQRPAPLTWSSRFNVRWEARWSSEGKYMV